MLDVIPDVALHGVLLHLDTDSIAYCRQVCQRLRSFIDNRKSFYPMHPVTVIINSFRESSGKFIVELKSNWTSERRTSFFALTSNVNRADNEEDDYSTIMNEFLREGEPSEEVYSVTSIEDCFREFLSAILREKDITSLELSDVPGDVLIGISKARKSRLHSQSIPTLSIAPQEGVEVELSLEVIEFCRPSDLSLYNFDVRDVPQILSNPAVQVCQSLICDLSDQDGVIRCSPEVFADLKCAKLDLQLSVPLTSSVLNRILKQWCRGERDFADYAAWELLAINELDIDQAFEGIPCQQFTLPPPRSSLQPCTYYRINRESSESAKIFIKNQLLLINQPTDYMLTMGSMF